MKKYIIILIIGIFSIESIAQNSNDSIIYNKIDQLQATINKVTQQQTKINKDSLSISVDKLTEILDKKDNILSDLLPSLIAILVVIISTGGAVFIGVRQIRTQTTNAEFQIRSQEAQAQDNLSVAREQILETSKVALAQVRENNVSQARIKWIEILKEDISEYLVGVSSVLLNRTNSNSVTEIFPDLDKDKQTEKIIEFYNEYLKYIIKVETLSKKIILNLNPQKKSQKKIINNIKKLSIIMDGSHIELHKEEVENLSNEIIEKARNLFLSKWKKSKKIYKK